jgi:hypothetical protein
MEKYKYLQTKKLKYLDSSVEIINCIYISHLYIFFVYNITLLGEIGPIKWLISFGLIH